MLTVPQGAPNPLPTIAGIAGSRGWIDPIEMAMVVGFQMKLVGVDYRTNEEMAAIMTTLDEVGFLEKKKDPTFLVRINPAYVKPAKPLPKGLVITGINDAH